ncbi:MAG: glycosyltransferase [Deltaproteobacteria bacterium]|nr:glycosyltransferase [Deltaproteobacteria bacterium]
MGKKKPDLLGESPLEEARVVIAVPLGSHFIYWKVVAAILELEKPVFSEWMVFQGGLADRARNALVEQMLAHPMGATHLFFLDADVLPTPDTLTRLLQVDQAIVSGVYRRRVPPHEPMAFTEDRKGKYQPILMKGKGGLKKVDVVGGGCLLIRREVFEKVKPPWFTCEWRKKGHITEDFSFCERARRAGFSIWVDTTLRPLHIEPVGIGSTPNNSVRFNTLT